VLGSAYLVMELLLGELLDRRLARNERPRCRRAGAAGSNILLVIFWACEIYRPV
jgi:hypothetical protein